MIPAANPKKKGSPGGTDQYSWCRSRYWHTLDRNKRQSDEEFMSENASWAHETGEWEKYFYLVRNGLDEVQKMQFKGIIYSEDQGVICKDRL